MQTAQTANELTPLSQNVLRSEVAERHLLMPSSVPASTGLLPRNDGTIVSIRRFRDLSEALVVRGVLEAAGIPCFLRNENTVRIDWQISNAIGGIRLDVLDSDVEAAESVMLPLATDTGEVSKSEVVCPRCGSQDIHRKHSWSSLAAASILTLGFSPGRGQKEWTCNACGALWADDEAAD